MTVPDGLNIDYIILLPRAGPLGEAIPALRLLAFPKMMTRTRILSIPEGAENTNADRTTD